MMLFRFLSVVVARCDGYSVRLHRRNYGVQGVPVHPLLLDWGYCTPTFQDTGEKFAANCCQLRQSAWIKLR